MESPLVQGAVHTMTAQKRSAEIHLGPSNSGLERAMQVQLGAVLADDREAVTLILEGDQVPGVFLKQDAAELSGTIERLAMVRANMAPEVVRELDPRSRVLPVADPIWRGTMAPDGAATLAFRHPGYGWVVFQLPPGEIATLGKFLVTAARPTPIGTSE